MTVSGYLPALVRGYGFIVPVAIGALIVWRSEAVGRIRPTTAGQIA